MDSILLDTSFCIRLLKSNDELHQNAKDYFKYFLEHKVEIYLSTIVIAEYSVKDDANNLLSDYNFNCSNINRNVIKDDCKLLAQICNRKISAYITKDKKSFGQIFLPIQKVKGFNIELLDLAIPLRDFKGELF